MTTVSDLVASWSDDVRALAPHAPDETLGRSGAELLTRWAEPARHYHTSRHLTEVIWALGQIRASGDIDRQCSVARLAAWFHDAVYDPGAEPGRNEADSAALARDRLRELQVGADDIDAIDRLILLTVGHDSAAADPLEAAFQDADLWILSAPERRFDGYCDQVRMEYARVPDAAYRRGRSAILAPLLHRDSIYRTAHARRGWERPARVNLVRELDRLGR